MHVLFCSTYADHIRTVNATQALSLMEITQSLVSTDAMQNRVGERLRSRIEALGISQAEAARRCGLSAPRFNNYVAGRRPPDVNTLMDMARALNTTTDYLLGFSVIEPPDMAGIVRRLLELEGMDAERAGVIAETAQEALLVLSALPDEGDADLRSRIAAQAAWQLHGGTKQPQ